MNRRLEETDQKKDHIDPERPLQNKGPKQS